MKTRLMVILLAGAFFLAGCGSDNNTSPLAFNQGRGNGLGPGTGGIFQCQYQPQPQEVVLPTGEWLAGAHNGEGNHLMPLLALGNPIPLNSNLAGASWQQIANSGVTGLPVQAGSKVHISGKFDWLDHWRGCEPVSSLYANCHVEGPATMILSDGVETYEVGNGNISTTVTMRNSGCLYFGGKASEGAGSSAIDAIRMKIFNFSVQYY